MNTALTPMATVASHLARLRTTPPRRHSVSMGPKAGCPSSQAIKRGELRAAAQAARRIKGTVGSTGKNRPISPRTRLAIATPISSHRAGAKRVTAAPGREGAGSGLSATPHFAAHERSLYACGFAANFLTSMTIREILKMGDLRLLRVAQPVTRFDSDALHLLVSDMFDTMHAVSGAGLAAPQIGVDLQLVIFGTDQVNPRYPDAPLVPRTVLLNPLITPLGSEEEEDWEGCLSVPGLRGVVPRWSKIRYTGFDQYGDAIERVVEGFHARVVQHECDHLIGKLYPMRIRDFTQFGYTEVLFPGLDASDDA